jgi:hypothetical protein
VVNVTGAYDIDCVAIMGHNFNSIAATSVSFILGTDSSLDAGANSYTVKTWNSPSAVRLAETSLYHTGSTPLRYSGVTWVGVKVVCAGAQIPRFTELWFGERVQFPYKPNVMWDPSGPLVSDVVRVRTDSGHMSSYVKNYGFRKTTAEWSLANTSANQTLMSTLLSDTTYWTKPFIFWETPSSAPRSAYVMVNDSAEQRWELTGPSERVFTLEMSEVAPALSTGT